MPINDATLRIVSALMSEGRFRRAYIGIVGGSRPLPPRLASETGRDQGIEVVEVLDGSPAAEAGLRPEDVITEAGGEPLRDVGDFSASWSPTGSTVRSRFAPIEGSALFH